MSDAQPSRRVEDAWAALRAGGAHDQTAKKVLQRYYGDSDRQQSDSRFQGPTKQPAVAVPAKPAAGAPERSKAAPEEAESAITTGLERSVQLLSNTGPSVRKSTLQRLQAACSSASPEQAAHALTEGLGKALLLRFEDTSEACRELAVGCFQQLLVKGEDATLHLLPYAMPVLEERLQLQEGRPREGSEEVRLQLATLLVVLVRQAGAAVGAYLAEVVAMVAAALADGYHEVNLVACSVVQGLIDILGQRLHSVSKQLVADVLPLTTHTRFRVRVVALQTLTPLMHLGAHEMILEMVAWRDPNMVPIAAFYGDDLKVNFCGKLASDPHTQVRAAFLDMIGNWMLTLTERMDHEGRLLPYVLSALCDDAPSVRDAAVKLLEQLGELFEKDHQKDLIEELEYLHVEGMERPCAAAVCWGQRPGAAGAAAASSSPGSTTSSQPAEQGMVADALVAASAAPAPAAAFHLPGPFSSRPRLGSRLLVQQNFSRIVGALVADVASWQAGPREAAVKLLLVQLVLMEGTVSQHLHTLLPAMVKAMSASNIAPAVEQCAEVMGCFADFGLLLELLQPLVTEAAAAPGVQADALTLLAACIRGGLYGSTLPAHAPAILQLLSLGTISASLDVRLNQASLAVLCALVEGLAQPVGLQQAAAVVQLLLGLVPWECAATAATTAGSGPLVVPSPPAPSVAAAAAAGGCGSSGGQQQQQQSASSVQAVLTMCEQLQLSASSSSGPEGLAQARLRLCEGVLVRLAARCQVLNLAQLLQVAAPQVLEQMEVGTWSACMPSPREVGRLCYLALPDPSAAPLLLQGAPLWGAAPPVAAGPYPVPADAKAASKLAVSASPQAAAGCCSSTSTSSSSECAVAVIEQVMQWLAHGSSDNSQQEGGGSQGTTHLGVLPDSSCALLLTAFDLVQQQPQQQPQQQQQQQQEQLAAGLVCLLQDSKTQLAGLRCCHWLLVGSSSSSASWAAAWCWRHCGCLVRILQGHSPLLQAWACQVLLDLARTQQQPSAAAQPDQGPLPAAAVQSLAGALDAANARVRCAAAAVLVEVLGVGGSGGQLTAAAESGDSWTQARQQALKALKGAGDVVAAAGLQAQVEALGCQ